MPTKERPNLFTRGGVFYARFQIAGRDFKRSLGTRDRRQALKEFARIKGEVERDARGSGRSWEDACNRWLAEVAPNNLKPATTRRYLVSLKQIDRFVAERRLEAIDRPVLARIAARSGTTNATRRRDLTALSSVLASAVEWGWLESNPAATYSRRHIRERRDPIVLPDDRDVARLTAALSPPLAVLVLTLRHAGLRLEEAAGLTWDAVDLRRRSITLTRTKGNRARVVPMPDHLAGSLAALPRFIGGRFVFWHGRGRRYRNLSSYLLSIRKGLTPPVPFRTHDLRHKFAVEYLKDGGALYDLQRILGHTTIRTTEGYLDYLTPEEVGRAKRSAG